MISADIRARVKEMPFHENGFSPMVISDLVFLAYGKFEQDISRKRQPDTPWTPYTLTEFQNFRSGIIHGGKETIMAVQQLRKHLQDNGFVEFIHLVESITKSHETDRRNQRIRWHGERECIRMKHQ